MRVAPGAPAEPGPAAERRAAVEAARRAARVARLVAPARRAARARLAARTPAAGTAVASRHLAYRSTALTGSSSLENARVRSAAARTCSAPLRIAPPVRSRRACRAP